MSWADNIEARAKILHGQIAGMRKLAMEYGVDVEGATAPYYELLRTLYEEDLPYARILDRADLIVTLKGASSETANPSLKVLGGIFDNFRQQVESIAKAITGLTEGKKPALPPDIDVALTGLARGSIVLGLQVRRPGSVVDGQQTLLDSSDPFYQAVKEAFRGLSQVARHIDPDSESGVDDHLIEEIPDPGVRDVVVSAAQRLSPSKRSGFDEIVLSVRDNGKRVEPAALTPACKALLKKALKRPVSPTARQMTLSGVVREIDLDAHRFELRRLEGQSYQGIVRCAYDKRVGNPRELLNAEVRITGPIEVDVKNRPRLMQVETVDIETPPEQFEL